MLLSIASGHILRSMGKLEAENDMEAEFDQQRWLESLPQWGTCLAICDL
jgi:hypothetical protein